MTSTAAARLAASTSSSASKLSLPLLSQYVKHGIGRLTASADGNNITRLTRVSHKAPTRWLPMTGKSSIRNAGAAICALSNYGGGMLQGDACDLSIKVEANARLGVVTQGANRIYKQKQRQPPNSSNHSNSYCQTTLEAIVENNGLLVMAPDPCSLFAKSSYVQQQNIYLESPSSNLALLDWFSSGRYRNGEAWEFDFLSSTTRLYMKKQDDSIAAAASSSDNNKDDFHLFLQDATLMDLRSDSNNPIMMMIGVGDCQTFASLLLYGDKVDPVQERCFELQDLLASLQTRIRNRTAWNTNAQDDDQEDQDDEFDNSQEADHDDDASTMALLQSLAGRVYMGISPVDVPTSDSVEGKKAHVVRFGATTNEDLYRIVHYCLQPLGEKFGMEFYKDRIRAKASEIPPQHQEKKNPHNGESNSMVANQVNEEDIDQHTSLEPLPFLSSSSPSSESALWSAFMLADSAMPTGSFAHSAGLEAAAQLGLVGNTIGDETQQEQVQAFIQAATKSTMQVTLPFLLQGHSLVANTDAQDVFELAWKRLDEQTQAVLACNAPACAASLDQGKSLARVAQQWLSLQGKNDNPVILKCLQDSPQNHMGPTLGVVAAMLDLTAEESCRLFGYCVARDMVSAAVRLSLVGPLASVPMLSAIQQASQAGIQSTLKALHALQQEQEHTRGDTDNANYYMLAAGSSAPIIEAIHPCHDLLQTRLFRS